MLNDYLTRAHSLSETGQPFVIATVVRAEKPTSAKAGAKAIVTADGALTVWVGGSDRRVLPGVKKKIEAGCWRD